MASHNDTAVDKDLTPRGKVIMVFSTFAIVIAFVLLASLALTWWLWDDLEDPDEETQRSQAQQAAGAAEEYELETIQPKPVPKPVKKPKTRAKNPFTAPENEISGAAAEALNPFTSPEHQISDAAANALNTFTAPENQVPVTTAEEENPFTSDEDGRQTLTAKNVKTVTPPEDMKNPFTSPEDEDQPASTEHNNALSLTKDENPFTANEDADSSTTAVEAPTTDDEAEVQVSSVAFDTDADPWELWGHLSRDMFSGNALDHEEDAGEAEEDGSVI